MYCYSSIQYLCEPCQAITERALPPESPYCLRPPTRLPPRRRLLSLILRSCLLREPSAPKAKVAAAKAPEAVNVQRGGEKKQNKKNPTKASSHRVSFYCRNRLRWSAAAVTLVAVWEPPRMFTCTEDTSGFIESQAAETRRSRGSFQQCRKDALIDIILRSRVFFVSFKPTIERKKLH